MFYWIYEIPNEWLALLIAGAFVLFYWIGCIVIRPILRLFIRSGAGTNDVLGYILSQFPLNRTIILGVMCGIADLHCGCSWRTRALCIAKMQPSSLIEAGSKMRRE